MVRRSHVSITCRGCKRFSVKLSSANVVMKTIRHISAKFRPNKCMESLRSWKTKK